LQPVYTRHGEIEHNHVRLQLQAFFERFGAIGCFAANLDLWLRFKEGANQTSPESVVIDEKDAFTHMVVERIAIELWRKVPLCSTLLAGN
jgi:hypothetical protein